MSVYKSSDVVKFSCVDNSYDLQDLFTKINNLKKLWVDGTTDFDLIRYLSDMPKISRQGQIYNAFPKKAYALPNWSEMKTFFFNLILAANITTNFNKMYRCIPIQIKKKNVTNDIDATLITVNNFFAHFTKEIVISRYRDDQHILPKNNVVNIYRYSNAMLKHIPEKALKTFQNKLLYSKKAVSLKSDNGRKENNNELEKSTRDDRDFLSIYFGR